MLDWIAVALSIGGCYLNAKKKLICWPIWFLSGVIWIVYWYPKREWAAITTTVIYCILNVYGYFEWKKDLKLSKGEER
jgi:nicotinamide mononucleotide transporter